MTTRRAVGAGQVLQFILGAALAAVSLWVSFRWLDIANLFRVSALPEAQPLWFRAGLRLGQFLPLVALGALALLAYRGHERAQPKSFLAGVTMLYGALLLLLIVTAGNH